MQPCTLHLLSQVGSSCCAALILGAAFGHAQIPEQYPKPLIHTSSNHPATRVLLLSVDGLHAVDLANFVATHPHSALAELSARGVTYTNARTPVSDPLAGLASLVTGGTPLSTGILSINGYDMHPSRDKDQHLELRVNTMFEVVHEKIGPTAWAGESAQTSELLSGPSRTGVDEVCPIDLSVHADEVRTVQVLNLIQGMGCSGTTSRPVPLLFGMSLTAIAQIQETAGYLNALYTPSPALAQVFDRTDVRITRILNALKAQHLYDSTWIVVASPYGQSPVAPHQHRSLPLSRIESVVNAVDPKLLAHIAGGGSVMLWLNDHAKANEIATALNAHSRELRIASIHVGRDLELTLNSAARDPHMPDIILESQPGFRWVYSGKDAPFVQDRSAATIAGYGGWSDNDTHVALLISGAQLTARSDPTLVPTTQLAPLLLRALGMEKFDLQALHMEHSPALPGIF